MSSCEFYVGLSSNSASVFVVISSTRMICRVYSLYIFIDSPDCSQQICVVVFCGYPVLAVGGCLHVKLFILQQAVMQVVLVFDYSV